MYKTFGFVHDDIFGRVAQVEFSLPAEGDYAYLLGSFNAFNEGSLRMGRSGDVWRIRVRLPEGKWHYAFSVNGEFTPDPENPTRELYLRASYKFNRETSVATIVGEEPVFHAPSLTYLYSMAGRTHVLLRARKGVAEKVHLVINGERVTMGRKAHDELFDYFEAVVRGEDELSYSFEVVTRTGKVEYGPFEAVPHKLEVPQWVFGSVFYQIMPDRFSERKTRGNTPGEMFHGGDLYGVIEHLGHLSALGVNALYLTPIFESRTYHGYDIEDYFHVAERLGGDEAFESLVNALRERKIRLVLDGVFHHTSFFHPYFQDVVVKGEKSRYRRFYRVTGFPPVPKEFLKVLSSDIDWVEKYRKLKEFKWNYESFFSVWLMPRLNHDDEAVREFVREVMKYWLERGADGWRLDVAHGVPPYVWEEVTKGLKDAYVFGEVMDDPRLYLGPLHGAMNYPLYELLLRFFVEGNIDAREFLNGLELLSARYGPFEYAMYNFLDNHDVDRFLHLAGKERYLCALAFLMTYRGVPSIFYGDEIGLDHFEAPFMERSRKPMVWDVREWDKEILTVTRELIRLRRESKALQIGEFVPLAAQGGFLLYGRYHGDERIVVGINISEKGFEIEIPGGVRPLIGHTDGRFLPSGSFFVGRYGV